MQQNDLCDRCRNLELIIEEFEKPVPLVNGKPDGIDASHQEIISRSSIDVRCRLCVQLFALFKACVKHSETTEVYDLVLKTRYWWHPDLAKPVAFHRISYRGKPSYVFLRLHGMFPLSIVDAAQVDYARLRHWFHNCKAAHGDCTPRERSSSALHIKLRAIDCRTRKVCELPPCTDYVCLSYVWGAAKIVSLHANACSKEPLLELPKTIEDAMYVTLQLGINYLWVDRYCINQRDDGEKHHMISNMDQIYQNATFTIIAAEGDGPHAGLPGVCGTPRKLQRVIRTKHLTLIGIESTSRYVQDSRWNTRGWTYQEMLLSQRILLFTDTRVYYQCLSGFGLEGVTRTIQRPRLETHSNTWSWTEKVPGTRPVFPILQGDQTSNTILERVSEYFERSLSFRADTVRAIIGIFNALSKTGPFTLNQFYGMPVSLHKKSPTTVTEDFVERLTWVTGTVRPTHLPGRRLGEDYGLPNTDLSTIMPGAELDARTTQFPSWSWAAFKADCPEGERARGIKLIFPCSHKQVDTRRSFDATDTEIRIWHHKERRRRLSNFVQSHHDFENYAPWIDITAWTWDDLFSTEMLEEKLDAYNICMHLDDSRAPSGCSLTAIHTVTYKTRYVHEEERLKRRVSGNPHERSYHIRMLLVSRNASELSDDSSQTYVRVGVLTMDTMWRGDSAPGSVEEVLKDLMASTDHNSSSSWKRKTLRLV